MTKLKAIAVVLPQFHPIPENDAWWGKGFTEWTNVTKAKPLFEDHYQPHLPTDLGFYDLRLAQARKEQADLAKAYGIHGFCYYHYWFNGKRLLHEPLDGMLKQQDIDMPFILCWANENWTRRWDGKDHEILIKQEYSLADDKAHIRWLCEHIFVDSRYIKVDGKPVFMVYRHNLFPDIQKTLETWRRIATNEYNYKGLYLMMAESFNDRTNPETLGFDASVEFSPHAVIKNKLKESPNKSKWFNQLFKGRNETAKLDIRDFKLGVTQSMQRVLPNYKLYRSVTPAWDNTPRKGENGVVALGSSPELYGQWLKQLKDQFEPYAKDENFIFINAMNEWAEGNYLEPCIKYGRAYLEATQKALK